MGPPVTISATNRARLIAEANGWVVMVAQKETRETSERGDGDQPGRGVDQRAQQQAGAEPDRPAGVLLGRRGRAERDLVGRGPEQWQQREELLGEVEEAARSRAGGRARRRSPWW